MATATSEILPQVDRLLEDQINQIWAYVREHRDNLDSERGCKMIRVACERAVEQVGGMLTEVSARLEVMSKHKADLKAELKELQRHVAEVQAKLLAAEAKSRELQDALDASMLDNAALQKRLDALSPKKKKAASEASPPAELPPNTATEPLIAKAQSHERGRSVGTSPAAVG